ncbi:MAG: hypothetical protein E7536_02200 [Ruminococcaceae bacterium]|nr:hypothetical protein [Oscillospiraceae bacterium]
MTKSLGNAKTIWVDKNRYPDFQKSFETTMMSSDGYEFRVAEFKKNFNISKEIVSAYITIFADCKYRLSVNNKVIGMGPVCAGGDFSNPHSLPKCYYTTYPVDFKIGENEVYAEVQTIPEVMTDTSKGKPCLIANIEINFSDSTTENIFTDETWLCRATESYRRPQNLRCSYYGSPWENAVLTDNIWQLYPSPIKPLVEEYVPSSEIIVPDIYKDRVVVKNNSVIIKYGSPVTIDCIFDKIYAGYPVMSFSGCNNLIADVDCQEFLGQICHNDKTRIRIEEIFDFNYRGIRLQSIGVMRIGVVFTERQDAEIRNIGIISTHYDEPDDGFFKSSDCELNRVFELCKHTLGICRQSLHLDSPYHQENLACTGDYYIESLMTYYCFGDTKLTRFDIIRTIDFLKMNDGFMFHTTYSLILLRMIYDYYMYSGDKSIIEYSIETLHILLNRFNSYTTDDGLITNPPNYMFVDHVVYDSYSMHHPPRALGETALNAFYYDALNMAVKLCDIVNDNKSVIYKTRAEKLKKSFNETFFDNEKGLYFDGRNFNDEVIEWRPCEYKKRYYSVHSNTLAVLYGLCDEINAKKLMQEIIENKALIQANPYFMHFVIDAVYKTGLFGKYGVDLLRKWTKLVDECDKGLKEVWVGFDCDYSHAWGGTPAYQLPARFSGIQILEPGMKKIKLNPSTYGLEHVEISIPTPHGKIVINIDGDGKYTVSSPEEIIVE